MLIELCLFDLRAKVYIVNCYKVYFVKIHFKTVSWNDAENFKQLGATAYKYPVPRLNI